MNLFKSNSVNHNQSYRADIDGLRAIAVLLVVFFHAFPTRIAGGFIGVDIFFVISGFLISSIILKELKHNNFTILGFYKKRINRIYPALIVVLVTSIIASKFFLFTSEIIKFNLSTFFSTIFGANLYFLNTLNYFDNQAESHPLLHLWSLGVEEQFYIFWPFLLIFVSKITSPKAIVLIVSILVLSFLTNILFVETHQSAVFYLPFTRFWELGFGSLCAYLIRKPFFTDALHKQTLFLNPDLISITGLLLIVLGVFVTKADSFFPGWYALLPVIGSGLIILTGDKSNFAKQLIANKLFVFIGLISYPLYLWHWPILAFGHIQLGYLMVGPIKVSLILLSIVLAIATYYLVEIPLRFKIKNEAKPLLLLITSVLIGLYAAQSYYVLKHSKQTEVDKFVTENHNYVELKNYVELNRVDCSFIDKTGAFVETLPSKCIDASSKKSILLWGDSHAYQLYSGLHKNLDKTYTINQVTTSGCHPEIVDLKSLHHENICSKANKKALELIRSLQPEIIVIAQKDSQNTTNWSETAKALKEIGVKEVILLGPAPQWNQYLYRYLAKRYDSTSEVPNYIGGSVLNHEILKIDNELKNKLSNSSDIHFVSIVDILCNKNSECSTFVMDENANKELTTFDYGHLGLIASDIVTKRLVDSINHLNN